MQVHDTISFFYKYLQPLPLLPHLNFSILPPVQILKLYMPYPTLWTPFHLVLSRLYFPDRVFSIKRSCLFCLLCFRRLESEIALNWSLCNNSDDNNNNNDLHLGIYWLQNPKCRKWENVRPIREIRAGSSNTPQITPNRRLSIPPTGLALVGETALGNQRPDFIQEKVTWLQIVLYALLCPGPCFPSSPQGNREMFLECNSR